MMLYYCNPERNPECRKSGCKYMNHGECDATRDESKALRSPEGVPLVKPDFMEKRRQHVGTKKVKDLIQELQKCDPEDTVIYDTGAYIKHYVFLSEEEEGERNATKGIT